MRPFLNAAVLTAVLAACGPPPSVVFRTTLSNPNGELPLPVALGDETGLVVAIGPGPFDPDDFRDAGLLADPADPKAFVLTWLGGACDNDAVLVFWSTDPGYVLHLTEHVKLGSCPALGVLRFLRIEASEPIPLDSITLSGSATIELRREEDCGPLRDAETDDAKIACGVLIEATVGERVDVFASVTVAPEDGACPGTECATAEGIEAQAWRVDATDRDGQPHTWLCSYHDESAACTVVANPAAS